MMQAVRGYYKQGQVQLLEPLLNVSEAEVFVVVNTNKSALAATIDTLSEEQRAYLTLQSQSRFAQEALLDPAEDVWNDL